MAVKTSRKPAQERRRGKPSKLTPARSKVTARRRLKAQKKRGPSRWWEVWVEFETRDVYPLDMDEVIENAARKKRDGSGTFLATGRRDHSYTVGSQKGAVAMALRVLNAMLENRAFTNVSVAIHRRVT